MPTLTAARNAVGLTFFLNGLVFASWVSRIPEVRSSFDLTNGALGLVLLAIALGSVLALPSTGAAINAWGTVRVVRIGAAAATAGMLTAALGLGHVLPVTVVGLFVYGLGIGVWDVAMNVEGAEVERGLRRTIMPRFHAGFSGGTVVGALLGALLIELDVPAVVHLVGIVLLAILLVWRSSPSFLPVAEPHEEQRTSAARAWLEPRTLLIGVMVLALAMTEGTANDWLAVALVDGHDVSHAVGVAGFAVFVLAMTAGRIAGTGLIDRFGRVTVLWGTMVLAGVGVLLIVLAEQPALVVTGIVLWGVGRLARVPGRDERGRRRPGPGRLARQRRLDDRLRRVPRGPAAPRVRRRPGRHPQGPAGRGRAADAGSPRGAVGPRAADRRRPAGLGRHQRARDDSEVEDAPDVLGGDARGRGATAVDDLGEQRGLARLEGHHLLLDGVGGDEAVDVDVARLSDAVRPVDGLGLGRRVPPRVEQEDVVGLGEGQSDPAGLEADQEDRGRTRAERLDDGLPVAGRAVEVDRGDTPAVSRSRTRRRNVVKVLKTSER